MWFVALVSFDVYIDICFPGYAMGRSSFNMQSSTITLHLLTTLFVVLIFLFLISEFDELT